MPKYHLEILSSADALPTIEFLGDVNDEARHSSMTNAAKWTKGITPLADEASGYEFIHGQKNLRTLNDSDTTLKAANFKVTGLAPTAITASRLLSLFHSSKRSPADSPL